MDILEAVKDDSKSIIALTRDRTLRLAVVFFFEGTQGILGNILVSRPLTNRCYESGILDGIIGAVESPFKVLVLDQQSTKIISAACTMTEITSAGISCTFMQVLLSF
jgi:hypothetical protein